MSAANLRTGGTKINKNDGICPHKVGHVRRERNGNFVMCGRFHGGSIGYMRIWKDIWKDLGLAAFLDSDI